MEKILFILTSLNSGGSENYCLRFIKQNGHEFDYHILSLTEETGDLYEEYVSAGCNVTHQPISYFNIVRFYQFYKLLKRNNFDAVCIFSGNFGGIPLTMARIAGVKKRITWYHRSTNAFGNNPLKKLYNQFINRLVRRNATTILSNSKSALNNFYGNYWKDDPRFQVVYNDVSKKTVETSLTKKKAQNKLKIPNDINIVGNVGRFNYAKNHETIFKVAAQFKNTDKNVHFLFCGRGTESEEFKQKVNNYGISDICYCLGLVEDIAWVYKSIDLFFFPSVTEGQPNALIEAMFADLPVVTSNIPPILEMLPERLFKFTAAPEDIEFYFEAINSMLKQIPDEQLSNREWAASQFNASVNFEKFKDVLKS